MEDNQTASRSARRFLEERVRDDWAWPEVPPCFSESDEEVRAVTEFRERYYGDSESDHESLEEEAADPYQFDSPESVGSAVEQKEQRRKKKHRAQLDEEMAENEGLRVFVDRRNAWTGAASVKKYGIRVAPLTEEHASASDVNTPMASDSSSPAPMPAAASGTVEDVIPVAPRMLESNPIRASISKRTYPDIYNKVVTSSRTPSVPINLADMTGALVQGWKDNGEWPPKAAPADPLAGKKRALVAVHSHEGQFLSHHPHMKKGMDNVKKLLHLNPHHEEGHGDG